MRSVQTSALLYNVIGRRPEMLRVMLKTILFAVACHCLLLRCAEASIIGTAPSFACWVSSAGEPCDGESSIDARDGDRDPGETKPATSQISARDLPLDANSTSGTSAPPSSSSSGSPAAMLLACCDLRRVQLVALVMNKDSLVYVGPSPSSLLRPPRCFARIAV